MVEADLYGPVKAFLEGQGYSVKGEIGACDVFAVRGDEAPVVVELKTRLSLALVLQAVDRLRVTDRVYLAFGTGDGARGAWRTQRRQVLRLVRRLGLGLLTVSAAGRVVAVVDPAQYAPRRNVRYGERLLREFAERSGDPEKGGTPSRVRMTAYRQDALRCAQVLDVEGTAKVSVVRALSGVARSGAILGRNHYGWFERVHRGHYTLTSRGRGAVAAMVSGGPA